MSSDLPSLFLSAERADALSAWRSPEANVANLRLPVDAPGAYPAALDRLIHEASAAGPLKALAPELERISSFVRGQFAPGPRRGLCVISCAKRGLFEAFASPEPFNAALSISTRPEMSALFSVQRDYHRFLVLLADKRQARFIEVNLGESCELETRSGDFTTRGGAAALAAHAEKLRRAQRAERFVLGASPVLQAALKPGLSPELRSGLILEPLLGPDQPAAAVTERVVHNEREARKVREAVLVQRFLDDLRDGGAVAGLEAAAAALQQGSARLLLLRDGYAKMGRCCGACGRLSVDHRSCPWCFRATLPVLDLVAELSDRAAAAGVEVFRVSTDARFDAAGRIGVCLAASPVGRRDSVPEARALRGLFALKRTSPRPGFA